MTEGRGVGFIKRPGLRFPVIVDGREVIGGPYSTRMTITMNRPIREERFFFPGLVSVVLDFFAMVLLGMFFFNE